MSLNIEDQADNTNQSAFAQALGGAQAKQTNDNNRGGLFDLTDPSQMFRSPMGRNPSSEILVKLKEAMEKPLKGINKPYAAALIPLDRNNIPKLSLSVLVVAIQDSNNPKIIGYHTLILEGSVDNIQPIPVNIGGQTVEVLRFASEAYNKVMIDEILKALSVQFNGCTFLNASATVVPRNFNVENDRLVYTLTSNAVSAAFTELATKDDFNDINLSRVSRNSFMSLKKNFSSETTVDAAGLPIRSDITIELQATPNAQQRDQLNPGIDTSHTLAVVNGFVDVVWDYDGGAMNYYNPNQSTHRYSPRFVLTNLESTRFTTIAFQLLALLSGATMASNLGWMNAFRPKSMPGNEFDMHDIGALNIEANISNDPSGYGKLVDTKASGFQNEYGLYISRIIRDGLILSMDVPEYGASTWFNEVFSANANGNKSAYEAIIDAANTLTDGNFGKIFRPGSPIMIEDNTIVHLGYYMDGDQVRDIRDLDYLAVANLIGSKDPGVIREWSDTFLQVQFPQETRLAARKRIITSLLKNVEFTGRARRLTFAPDFIRALNDGVVQTGITIRDNITYNDFSGANRGVGSHLSNASLQNYAGGAFSHDYGGYAGFNNNTNGFFSRNF